MENFKDIIGYEGIYSISPTAKIKSKNGYISNGWEHSKLGYRKVRLYKNNNSKDFYLHRLVAMAFIPNTYNKTDVNHIDNNPRNNNVDNLEWCTHKENVAHCTKHKRHNPKTTKVINIITGEKFDSIKLAAESIGMKQNTLTYKLLGKRKNNTDFQTLDIFNVWQK
jgi:hypothetical protein